MANRQDRPQITGQETDEVLKLRAAADAARRSLADLQAQFASMRDAQSQVTYSNRSPGLVTEALGGRAVKPGVDLNTQFAAANRSQSQQIASAKQAANALALQNRSLQDYLALMAKSTSAADREWAAQQRLNAQRQKAMDLSRQLGLPVPGPPGSSNTGQGGSSSRFGGMAASGVRMGLSAIGASTGIPGAGMAGSLLGELVTGLPTAVLGAIGMGLAGIAATLGVTTVGANAANFGQVLGGSTALGNGRDARSLYTQAVMQQGEDFLVPLDQNNANAQMMGQMGVPAESIVGNQKTGAPSALGLAYAVGTNAGMDLAQAAQMVATYMVKQNATVSQASQAFQVYAQAAAAAGVPLQRMFSLMQQMQALNENGNIDPGKMASLQAQLGMGVNPVQLLAPAMTATGFQAKAQEAMLGMSQKQFEVAQRNPTVMFDAIAAKAKAAAGGNTDTLAGLLGVFGMDLSGMTPEQVTNLAQMIESGKPGQAQAYYKQYVRAGANQPTQPTDTFIGKEAAVRATTLPPPQKGQTAAQYAAYLAINGYALPYPEKTQGPPTSTTPSAQHPIPDPGTQNNSTVAPPGMTGSGTLVPPSDAVQAAALRQTLPASLRPFADDYVKAHKATGVPIEVLVAQDMVESGGDPTKFNKTTGAAGLGQIMPALFPHLGITNPLDPAQNITGQARYDKELFAQFGDWNAVFAAYDKEMGGYQKNGMAGTEPGYMAKIDATLNDLKNLGWNISVTVTAKGSDGHPMPSTATIRKAPTTAPYKSK